MNRSALERRKTMLLLGAIDMDVVIAAAQAMVREQQSDTPDEFLVRALEAAIVVCYYRPFSQANTLGSLSASDAEDRQLHSELKALRDSTYAHIDLVSGRKADIGRVPPHLGGPGVTFTEDRWGFPDQRLPTVIEVAARQRDRWRAEAVALRDHLANTE